MPIAFINNLGFWECLGEMVSATHASRGLTRSWQVRPHEILLTMTKRAMTFPIPMPLRERTIDQATAVLSRDLCNSAINSSATFTTVGPHSRVKAVGNR